MSESPVRYAFLLIGMIPCVDDDLRVTRRAAYFQPRRDAAIVNRRVVQVRERHVERLPAES